MRVDCSSTEKQQKIKNGIKWSPNVNSLGTLKFVLKTCVILRNDGNWKVDELLKQLKSRRDFRTTVLNEQKESVNEHGSLDSDVFGSDRQDQECTKASSSEPLEGRDNASNAGQDNLVGTTPLAPTFSDMMLTRSGGTVVENTPTPTKPAAKSRATWQISAALKVSRRSSIMRHPTVA